MEINAYLANRARRKIKLLGYKNIKIIIADGKLGYKKDSPYDAIIVTAETKSIPGELIEQLTVGGKIVIPIIGNQGTHLFLGVKKLNGVELNKLMPVRFVTLI